MRDTVRAVVVLRVRVPLRVPIAVGTKLTETEQVLFAGMLVPQVLIWVKSPVAATDAMGTATAELLVTVTVCAAEVAVRVVAAKVRDEEERVRGEPPTVPVRVEV